MNIDIELQPKEYELLQLMESDNEVIGYGGARGGAKSHAARSAAIIRRLQYPGTKALVFRKTYDDLWQNHISKMMSEWPELYRQYWSGEQKALMLPGNSMVLFRYADTLKDVLNFKGKEFDDIFIDEASDQTSDEIVILQSCCRSIVPGFKPKKVLTFNPGGVGHAYLKRLFVDKDLTKEEKATNPTFIQAYAWDNVMWVRDPLAEDGIPIKDWYGKPTQWKIDYLVTRSSYGKFLNNLPPYLRRPWLFGDWDVFSGQVFTDFRREIHVVEPFEIKRWWKIWGSNDPGFADPGTWYAHAATEGGQVVTFREWTFDQRTPYSEQAKAVKRSLDDDGLKISEWVTGMDAFNPHPETGKSIADVYRDPGGLGIMHKPDHGAGARKRMAGVVHEYLTPYADPHEPARKTAKWQIFSTCKQLIGTLPSLPADQNKPEQVAECPLDHWYQGAGYGLVYHHNLNSTPPKEDTYKPGTAGDILRHAEKMGEKKKDPVWG